MQWRTKYYYFKTSSKLDVQLSTLFILCPFWRSMGKLTQPFNGPLPVSTCNLQCCTQQTGQKRVMICHNRLRRIGAKPPVDDLAGQWETVGTPVAHNSPPVTCWKENTRTSQRHFQKTINGRIWGDHRHGVWCTNFQHKTSKFEQDWAVVLDFLQMGEGLCWALVTLLCISGYLRYDLW